MEIKNTVISPGVGVLNNIAEMWTFAETDFQIITLSSGFGKLGWSLSHTAFVSCNIADFSGPHSFLAQI
jgi:hypothetical protein